MQMHTHNCGRGLLYINMRANTRNTGLQTLRARERVNKHENTFAHILTHTHTRTHTHTYTHTGNDPCSIGGVFWCAGLFDGPKTPDRSPSLSTCLCMRESARARELERERERERERAFLCSCVN
jgi:hypothetical protein